MTTAYARNATSQPAAEQKLQALPCPFCGSDAVTWIEQASGLSRSPHAQWHSVKCSSAECPVMFETKTFHQTEQAAVQAWNTRAGAKPSS